ncbi:MAG: hypothetical protein HYT72_04610 [Candidatus Aenigmarchaeota archaeon]|nr:hypothetical protein [Candidatus Aenigmarchaeota archaeon]
MPDYNFITFQRAPESRELVSAFAEAAKGLKWAYRQVPPTLEKARTVSVVLHKPWLGGSVSCIVELGRRYPTVAVTSTLSMGDYDRFTTGLKGALRQ